MSSRKDRVEFALCPVQRGETVRVNEAGIKPWWGVVTSTKFSPVSGWWVDVRTDDGTWVVRASDVETTGG